MGTKSIKLTVEQQTVFDFLKALSDVELLACDINEKMTKVDLEIAISRFKKDITETEVESIINDGQANTQMAIAIIDKILECEGE